MCNCQLCSKLKIHNVHYINYMANDLSSLENPVASAKQRLWKIFEFFLGLLKYVGIFFLGIIIGMGIVLKDPVVNKKQQIKIETLEKEIIDLKQKINNSKVEVPQNNIILRNAVVVD